MHYFLILFLSIQVYLCSKEIKGSPASIANIEGGLSAYVSGCVNAITEDFTDCPYDLILGGHEPFILQRCYFSSDYRIGTLIMPNILLSFTDISLKRIDLANKISMQTVKELEQKYNLRFGGFGRGCDINGKQEFF